ALTHQRVAAVLGAARAAAEVDGMRPGLRVLSTRRWRTADEVTANLLGPLLSGAALVWVDPAGGHDLAAIAATEHTDLTLTA
ncbi:MAG: TIGR03089 family protein, partial [Gordonia sp. (in: high G+C Gram-positive bacteria)]